MLSSADGLGNDLRRMDPETQARLEALLEAAGKCDLHTLLQEKLVILPSVQCLSTLETAAQPTKLLRCLACFYYQHSHLLYLF